MKVLDQNKEYIIREYINGKSMTVLGKEFCCNSGSIYYALKEWNITTREKKTKKGDISKYDKKIVELHSKGLSSYQISKQLGFSSPGILARAKVLNINFSNKSTWKNPIRLKDIKEEIINLYNSGISTNKIADQTGYSSSNVWKLLQKEGIDTSHEYYDVDLDFFKEIGNYDKSYILGMWYADGCVKSDKISLQLADKEIVDYAKSVLKYDGPIHIVKPRIEGRKIQYDLAISRQVLVEDLILKGCPHKKSLILQFPSSNIVPNNLINHFILGWFDGDGNIYYYKKQNKWKIQLVGTKEFLEGVLKITNCTAYWSQRFPERNNNNWSLQIAMQSEVIKFLEFIYKDNQFCLQRKKVLADKCLEDLKSRSNLGIIGQAKVPPSGVQYEDDRIPPSYL